MGILYSGINSGKSYKQCLQIAEQFIIKPESVIELYSHNPNKIVDNLKELFNLNINISAIDTNLYKLTLKN